MVYYPTSDSSDRTTRSVDVGDRIFTAVELQFQTSYTFEVEAVNNDLFARSSAATLSVSTSAPQG